MTDLGATYIRARAMEVRLLRNRARRHAFAAHEQVRRASMAGTETDRSAARQLLVRCLANLYIASAICEALGDLR